MTTLLVRIRDLLLTFGRGYQLYSGHVRLVALASLLFNLHFNLSFSVGGSQGLRTGGLCAHA
jgi:hypothetical protein